jgi:hypothetical protein
MAKCLTGSSLGTTSIKIAAAFKCCQHRKAAFVLREIIRYSPAISAQGLNTSIANPNQLPERAQDRTASDTDTRLPFLQHCHQEEVSRAIVNIPAASSFSQASEPE